MDVMLKNLLLCRTVLSILCFSLCIACGFEPVHKQKTTLKMAALALNEHIYQENLNIILRDQMRIDANAPYRLEVTLTHMRANQSVTRESEVARVQFSIELDFTLYDTQDQKILWHSKTRKNDAYNREESETINMQIENALIDNILRKASEELIRKLQIYLATRKPPTP